VIPTGMKETKSYCYDIYLSESDDPPKPC